MKHDTKHPTSWIRVFCAALLLVVCVLLCALRAVYAFAEKLKESHAGNHLLSSCSLTGHSKEPLIIKNFKSC